MRLLIAALLSAGLITLIPTETPVNNSTTTRVRARTVQAVAPEKATEVQSSAPTEQKVEVVPEPQPTPQVEVATSHPVGCENYRHLISQYDWNHEVALQIAHAESGCNPSAVGDQFEIAGIYAPSCGLFQVRTLSSRPTCEALKDPATNIAWAYRIYQGQGYGAWSVCNYKVRCM